MSKQHIIDEPNSPQPSKRKEETDHQDHSSKGTVPVVIKLAKFSSRRLRDRLANYEQIRAKEVQSGIANYAEKISKRVQASATTTFEEGEDPFKGRINPEGTFKKVWETSKFFLLIYILIYLPVKVAFLTNSTSNPTYYIDKLIDLFFLIDIGLTFFSPIYVGVEMVFSLKELAKNYIKGWLFVDVISLIPFEDIVSTIQDPSENLQFIAQISKALRLMRLIKLIRLFKAFDFTNADNFFLKYMEMYFKGTVIYLLLPNFLLMSITIHLFSCFWYYIATIDDTNTNWIVMNGFSDERLLDLYIISFYFVIQTFTTCGYGDIYSYRNVEIIFRIPIMFAGVFLYGIFSGRIVEYRSKKMAEEEISSQRAQALERLLKEYVIPDFHYRSILEQLYENNHEERKEYDFSNLSQEEKDMFDYHKYLSKFKNNKLFSKHPDQRKFVIELGRLMKVKSFKQDQIIYHKGDPPVYFYVIQEGSVSVMMHGWDTFPIIHVKGGFFGEHEMIAGTQRMFTVRAAQKCTLHYMDAQDFKRFFLTDQEDIRFKNQMEYYSHSRYEVWAKSQTNFAEYLRRKVFWKMVLSDLKSKKRRSIKNLIKKAENSQKKHH